MKTCAIIIPAYDCAEFIPDLVAGLRAQYETPGWIYDFRIACDACEKTSRALKALKFPHWQAARNVGHGIMRNALIEIGPADAYAYFDADDKMMPAYLKRSLQAIKNADIVMPAKLNTNVQLKPKTGKPVIENGGAMTFTRQVVEAVGGFAPYRCAIDTDFMRRCEMAGYTIKQITEALYYRRGHGKCLTKAENTRIGSPLRKRSWEAMCAVREGGIYKIEPASVELKKVK